MGEVRARFVVGPDIPKRKLNPPAAAAENNVPPAIIFEPQPFELFSQAHIGRLAAPLLSHLALHPLAPLAPRGRGAGGEGAERGRAVAVRGPLAGEFDVVQIQVPREQPVRLEPRRGPRNSANLSPT